MTTLSTSSIALLVCCSTFCFATPTPQLSTANSVTSSGTSSSSDQHQAVASSHVQSSANGILVSVSESQVNEQCVANLKIYGNGIDKTTEYPCGKAPVDIINLKNGLAIADEWFSDQPKTLVHLTGDKCEKEVFTQQGGKTSSTSVVLSEEECRKVRDKISELKKEQQKWKDWLAQQEETVKHQFDQLQQNFQWFQSQLGGLFGGK